MERIPIYDYKARLSEYGRLAKEAGKRFIVTNRGEDMFEIGPVSHERDTGRKAEAMETIERLTADLPRQSAEQNRADIEHGRR